MNIAEAAAIVNALNAGGSPTPTPTPASGGWDFIIKVDGSTSSWGNWELAEGDWDAVALKLTNGRPVTGICYYYNIPNSAVGIAYYFDQAEYHQDNDEIALFFRNPASPSSPLFELYWMSDNTIETD